MKTLTLVAVLLATTALSATAAYAQEANSRPAVHTAAGAPLNTIISVETVSPEIRVVKFANPPVNLITPETLVALNQVVKDLGKDEKVKVVIFTSGVDGYFFNHFDMNQFPNFLSQVGDNAKPLWVELITNLSNAPFITIASIHGRTQGGGDELALAFDLRYASEEKAVFGQPEVGIGLFPGGGGTDHLARLAGRDRALEVFLTADDYDARTAERFGWVTRTLPDAELDGFVARIAQRLATFDKTALITTKQHINAVAAPTEADLLSSYSEFTKSLSWPGLQQRMPVFGQIIQQVGPEKVESNLGYYVGEGNKQLHEQNK